MKRRRFITKSAATCTAFLSFPNNPFVSKYEETGIVYSYSPQEITIAIEGLKTSMKIIQITDAHISRDTETDIEFSDYSKRMNGAYQQVTHYKTQKIVTPLQCFVEILKMAKDEGVDLIVLTGDIVNYPSYSAIKYVRDLLEQTKISYIYTAGNHDWHYEGMPGNASDLRNEWCEKRLKPLYQDNGKLFSSNILNGINLILIDNSTYQLNKEQLDFFKLQKSMSLPMVLFSHIPYYMPSMDICCGHPAWGASVDVNYKLEKRERWPKSGNNSSTIQFLKELMNTPQLIGIFTGHWHQSRVINFNGNNQFISAPALNGQYQKLNFVPLET